MRRAFLVIPVLALLACEHLGSAPEEIEPRSKRESAAGLLRVELQLAAIEDFIRYTPGIPDSENRLAAIQFLRAHIARCEGWLAGTEGDRRRLAAAHVGLDFAGVGYDLIRIDLEATLRHLSGVARSPANIGLNAVWRGIHALERDLSSATTREVTGELLGAEERRDALLKTVPTANVLRPGVLAASNTSSAYGLAKVVSAAGPVLGRLGGFLTNPAGATVGVEVSASGAAISVVAGGGTLVLTEAEIIALAQTSAISIAALQLAMMANGRPPKVPDPKRFAEWVKRTPTRSPQQPDAPFTKFQVKYAGPVEHLVEGASSKPIWADGVREADCRLLETKLVGDPKTSPFVNLENRIQDGIRNQVRDELARYAAAIRDPASPAIALEVITNEPRAVPFFESLLRELRIPGEVVVRPFP